MTTTLVPLNPFQMKSLKVAYSQQTGKDFMQTLDKETSGNFLFALRAIALGPLGFDCELIKKAVAGVGYETRSEIAQSDRLLGPTRQS